MKYQLQAPFHSISGVIERQKLSDGSTRLLIAKANGTMYWMHHYPRTTPKQEVRP